LTPVAGRLIIIAMRLTEEQRRAILSAVHAHFGEDARVLLFGSRVDDRLRGGDIDLLVETISIQPDSRDAVVAKVSAVADIQRAIGERKIDLVVTGPGGDAPIAVEARSKGVAL